MQGISHAATAGTRDYLESAKLTLSGELVQFRLHGLRQQHLRLDLGHLDVAVRVAIQQELKRDRQHVEPRRPPKRQWHVVVAGRVRHDGEERNGQQVPGALGTHADARNSRWPEQVNIRPMI